MKRAFTMIELVFVIVIIGILAAVAIPKLAATRDDASISNLVTNARQVLQDFQSYYTSRGHRMWTTDTVNKATNVLLEVTTCGTPVTGTTELSENTFVLCNNGVVCLTFETVDEGNLTITDGTDITDMICEAVKEDLATRSFSNKTYRLGGSAVVR